MSSVSHLFPSCLLTGDEKKNCSIMDSHGRVRAPILSVFPHSLPCLTLFLFLNFIPLFLIFRFSHSFFTRLSHLSLSFSLTHVCLPRSRSLPSPLLSLCISCIVNSSQKHDKVSAHVPPASLSVLPAICYCLLAIVCLSL